MSRARLLSPLAALIAGCPRPAPVPAPSDPGTFRRGLLAADGGALTACGAETATPLKDSSGLGLAALAAELSEQGPVYAELLARDEDGALVVTDLNFVGALGSAGCGLELEQVLIRASGNEPFWLVEIDAGTINFSAPDHGTLTFPSPSPEQADAVTTWRTELPGNEPHTLTLTLTRDVCRDSMSGALLRWSAAAELDGVAYSGCARSGW